MHDEHSSLSNDVTASKGPASEIDGSQEDSLSARSEASTEIARRRLLVALVGASAYFALPSRWTTPLASWGILPAHAGSSSIDAGTDSGTNSQDAATSNKDAGNGNDAGAGNDAGLDAAAGNDSGEAIDSGGGSDGGLDATMGNDSGGGLDGGDDGGLDATMGNDSGGGLDGGIPDAPMGLPDGNACGLPITATAASSSGFAYFEVSFSPVKACPTNVAGQAVYNVAMNPFWGQQLPADGGAPTWTFNSGVEAGAGQFKFSSISHGDGSPASPPHFTGRNIPFGVDVTVFGYFESDAGISDVYEIVLRMDRNPTRLTLVSVGLAPG